MVVGGGVPVVSGSCDTVVTAYNNTGASAGDYDITDATTYFYVGHHFITVAETINVCKARFYLTLAAGTITGKTFTAYIYVNDGSGHLTDLLGTSTGVTGSQGWSDTAVDFTFSPAVTLSSGTTYAVVISMGAVDADNYAEMEYTATGALTGLVGRWGEDLQLTGSGSLDTKLVLYVQ
jgi:hypothetical protein